MYGVGPPGVRLVVGAGCPTGPCCFVVEVVVSELEVVVAVVARVGLVADTRVGEIVCL